MMPEYRPVEGFPGYRVGDDGSVWGCWITCRSGRRMTDRWKQLKLNVGPRGYLRVNLTPVGGSYKTFRVHRLVLAAFVGPCPEGMECRHLNGIKTDCRLDNLRWGTQGENVADNHRMQAYEQGERHKWHKLTADEVRAIRSRFAAGGVLLRELAAEYNVSVPNIHAVVHRRSWANLV
jgi:hypothetical protein